MYKTVEAIWRNGEIVPLESISATENSRLLATILTIQEQESSDWKQLRGKYRDKLSSVDDYMASKQEEKQLEI